MAETNATTTMTPPNRQDFNGITSSLHTNGMPRFAVHAVTLFALVAICGCAAPGLTRQGQPAPHHDQPARPETTMTLWRLSDLARIESDAILLRSPMGIHGAIDTALVRRILGICSKLVQIAPPGTDPELAILASENVNAFAFYNGNQPTIAISQGMVRLLGKDDDAWAALIGHELAHLRLEHHQKRLDRHQRTDVASSVAGAVLSAFGVPLASLATDATATLANRAYSRDDERDADRAGLEYTRSAGFDVDGAIRLQQYLLGASENVGIPFLSTHPGGQERIDDLKAMLRSAR